MNPLKRGICFAIAIALTALLTGCEQKIFVESAVNEDGAIDRTITFSDVDKEKLNQNMFGLIPGNSWESNITLTDTANDRKYTVRYHKRFPSVTEANAEFDNDRDSLFHIKSSFEKRFRWFYTYIDYSDTYRAINRFKALSADEFFTAEDMAFINRLPAEGKPISKPDSIYLSGLTEKIYVKYALAAVFEENFAMITEAAKNEKLEPKWIDSLTLYKKKMFDVLSSHSEDDFVFEEPFMIQLMDSLEMTFPTERIATEYRRLYAGLTPRLKLMIEASYDGKFTHRIRMPWNVIDTNADSIAADGLYWKPPVTRFALRDYTMYATARKLNYWAMIVSAVIVVLAVFVVFRRKG